MIHARLLVLCSLLLASCQSLKPTWEYMAMPFPVGFDSAAIQGQAHSTIAKSDLATNFSSELSAEQIQDRVLDMQQAVSALIHELNAQRCADFTESASMLGADGWELFSINDSVYYYRRQK